MRAMDDAAAEGSTGYRIEVEGIGPCWLIGAGHTFRGRMLAVMVESGQGLHISKDEIVDPAPEVAAWVEGFLAGQEPDFAEWLGLSEPLGDAFEEDPVVWARYEACLRSFRETGHMPYRLHRRPTAPPPSGWEARAWTIVAGEVLRWDGTSWVAADPQPAFTFEVLVGSACDGPDGHDLELVGRSREICTRCGVLTEDVIVFDPDTGTIA